MADTTDVLALPYPEGADANDVPADMQALAERVDEVPGVESLTSAEIAALASGEKPAGRVVWNSTTSKLQVSNGTTFTNIDAASLLLTGGTMSGAIAMGGAKITGLAAGTTAGDAVRYEQLTALGTYSDWTPTLTADSSNPTASANTGFCRYTQIGKKVTGTGHMTVTAAGVGSYRIPLPVAPAGTGTAGRIVGKVTLFGGANTGLEYTLVIAPSQNYCYGWETYTGTAAINYLDHITYAALTGDRYLTWQFDYEAA